MKLIGILNKIANGELKEGTKVKWGEEIYTYHGDDELYRTKGTSDFDLWDEMYLGSLNEEIELIEPNDFTDVGKMAEPTDNTTEKIEKLDYDDFWEWDPYGDGYEQEEFVGSETAIKMLFEKLNEVIRRLNKEKENE